MAALKLWLPKLKFDAARHTLCSLMAVVPTTTLASLSSLPLSRVYRGGPLPSISQGRGISLLLGGVPNGDMLWLFAELFTALQGKVQHVKDDAQFKILFSVDCMMGPFYYQVWLFALSCYCSALNCCCPP